MQPVCQPDFRVLKWLPHFIVNIINGLWQPPCGAATPQPPGRTAVDRLVLPIVYGATARLGP